MRVSIIVPAYNASEFISETIESVVAQTIRDWELVIVDDGSQDSTASIVASYSERDSRIRVVTQPNQGVAAARNQGFLKSNTVCEYVAFLDQDDIWEPDALETLAGALHEHPEAAAAHGRCQGIDSAGNPILGFPRPVRKCFTGRGFRTCRPDEPTTLGVFLDGNMIYTPGQALIRRKALSENPFDPALVPADDWDLWLRLSARQPLAFVEKTVLGWRRHEGNQSKNWLRMAKARRRVYGKLIILGLSNDQQDLLAWYLRSKALHRAYRRDLRRSARYAGSYRPGRAVVSFLRAALGFVGLRRERQNITKGLTPTCN